LSFYTSLAEAHRDENDHIHVIILIVVGSVLIDIVQIMRVPGRQRLSPPGHAAQGS
jgi:hypothetical protein